MMVEKFNSLLKIIRNDFKIYYSETWKIKSYYSFTTF